MNTKSIVAVVKKKKPRKYNNINGGGSGNGSSMRSSSKISGVIAATVQRMGSRVQGKTSSAVEPTILEPVPQELTRGQIYYGNYFYNFLNKILH